MIFIADSQSIYQLSEKFGQSDLIFWIILVVIWTATARWRLPTVAEGEDEARLQQLGRKRSRWIAVSLVAAAVLWPVLGFFFLYIFGCHFASC
ncbi:hypothetical protein ACFV2H_52600 [Streptomyces sp. NPDC059629]|uniref:hypothetical protein n=1 Tax=Streptomyces sp. NPDC059629 TaxID=3346889 RepID=UPI0036AEDA26